jgi:hypothetical protein
MGLACCYVTHPTRARYHEGEPGGREGDREGDGKGKDMRKGKGGGALHVVHPNSYVLATWRNDHIRGKAVISFTQRAYLRGLAVGIYTDSFWGHSQCA